ncbi:MAG: ABC transporter ATP-binding protein [Kiritimatiellae bacterium]|nr:ABC transporter ATP-binding protein [Kiritimatiellia bacterium]
MSVAVAVVVDRVVKKFGAFTALRDVSLEVEPGELFFLLGPSGCGKTTLLRCVAGFHVPESGRILIGGRDVTRLPPYKRDTGMMFQSYALWPHMTLEENVAFGLEMRRIPRVEIRARARRALELVHLLDRAKTKPNELSGGEQQRVALARALVVEPQCLLLDEPLSNLDAKLRLEMRIEIRRICKEAGLTAIYVTHDQKEALSIADRMAVMRNGVIEQIGTPEQVYRHPDNCFVAGFMGEANFIEGVVIGKNKNYAKIKTLLGEFASTAFPPKLECNDQVFVCLRPESLRFDQPGTDGVNLLRGVFQESVYLGEVAQHQIALPLAEGGSYVMRGFELNPRPNLSQAGAPAQAWVAPESVIVIRQG